MLSYVGDTWVLLGRLCDIVAGKFFAMDHFAEDLVSAIVPEPLTQHQQQDIASQGRYANNTTPPPEKKGKGDWGEELVVVYG